ncbi:MAG TPA: hypothetical protein VHE81_01780 [Lacipirellulaceae bacterium]|nr:hypothetical protein [Lacipirellulaceae bacterium]
MNPTTHKRPAPKPAAPRPAPKPTNATPAPVVVNAPPAAAVNDASKTGAAATTENLAPPPESNPAVLTALELPRKKPADYLQAVLWLIDLGRPELAKPIMADLVKSHITDAQRQELVDQFGSGNMLKIARTKELAPDGPAFADACMAAASAAENNPQRIDTLIKQLTDRSPEVRLLAQHDLAASGGTAAKAILEALARESDASRRAALSAGAATTHPLVDGMLLAMLDTRDPALHIEVANLLRQLQVPQAAPLLQANAAIAERALTAALYSHSHGTPVFKPDQNDQVELWQWNDATKQLSSIHLPAKQAQIVWMSKLARALYRLQPTNPDYRRQAIVLAWEAAPFDASQQLAPGGKNAATPDPMQLNEILAESLKENLPYAAVDAANGLATCKDPSALLTPDGKPSPLADAIESPDRRVRFAALRAIMTLDPSSPYPGSSRVPDAVAWFSRSTTERRALVAMPTLAAATNLAGLLAGQDLSAQATNSGRDLLTMARNTTDVDAIFVDMNIILPGIREVLYELRINPTTGDVPIAILAADGRLEAAKKLAAEHRRVIAVPRPHSPEVVANTVKQLHASAASDTVPTNERIAEATQARAWLAKLASGHRSFYVIRDTAAFDRAPSPGVAPARLPTQ